MYTVIGASGFLGSYVLKNILEKTEDNIIAVARNVETVICNDRIDWYSCDLTDKNSTDLLLEKINDYPEKKVIYLAACPNPDMVDKDPVHAWNINVTSVSYFVNAIENVKCFFYSSTDSVYGNSIDGYRYKEEDPLSPVNTYGKQKCAAESIVIWRGYNVVRYPYLIASSLSPAKKHFYDIIVDTLTNGNEMEMFKDWYRSALNLDTAASLLIELVERYTEAIPKILNLCGDNAVSKYDIGLMIADKLGVDRKRIIPITTEKPDGIFETQRAQSTLMDNSKLKKVLNLSEIKLKL